MFRARARKRKQPKLPSTDNSISTRDVSAKWDHCPAIKRNEVLKHGTAGTLKSEKKTQEATYFMTSLM